MLEPTELIYTGSCKELLDAFNKTNKILIKRENIKIKEGTLKFQYGVWAYYPVSFQFNDNVEHPKYEVVAGDFMGFLVILENRNSNKISIRISILIS